MINMVTNILKNVNNVHNTSSQKYGLSGIGAVTGIKVNDRFEAEEFLASAGPSSGGQRFIDSTV